MPLHTSFVSLFLTLLLILAFAFSADTNRWEAEDTIRRTGSIDFLHPRNPRDLQASSKPTLS